jgi:hypothetical protein
MKHGFAIKTSIAMLSLSVLCGSAFAAEAQTTNAVASQAQYSP